MTPYGFLAWAATQGIKHIPKKFLLQAFNSFKGKLPSNQVILKTAKNLYDDLIKKTPTKDLTKQIRQKIKKDKTLDFNVPLRNKQSKEFIKEWNKNTSPKQWEKIIENLEGIKIPKKPFQGFKPPIVPKQFNKFRPRVIQGGKSKKPIPAEDIIKKGDWDPSGFKSGGRIDKALPKKSRDI